MPTRREWTFDVALSFSGEDREKARALARALSDRGITVFFDEWFKAHIWGQNLAVVLRDIYLAARFCVPLISRSYVTSAYAQHELEVMLERQLLESAGSLLPVRLDDTDAPGLSKTVATVRYAAEGPDGIAALITQRLAALPATANVRVEMAPAAIHSTASRLVLPTHRRQFPSATLSITVPELLDLARNPDQHGSVVLRARAASEFVIYLNHRHSVGLGIPYAAWREDRRFYVSALPSLSAPQRTLEFELNDAEDELHLVSEWDTADSRYATLDYREWQPAVRGLTADRSDIDTSREACLLILEKKEAVFGFPITPGADSAEKLCSWLEQEPPNDYLDWGRDPRLLSDNIALWQTLYHRPTGVGLLYFVLHGRWSATAFSALADFMRLMLPTRHGLKVMSRGVVRVTVLLSITPGFHHRHLHDFPKEVEHATRAFVRSCAAIARMHAALRRVPVTPPEREHRLPPLGVEAVALFEEALQALGDGEYPHVCDSADAEFDEAPWIKLRQAFEAPAAFRGYDREGFRYSDVVTVADIRHYLDVRETS